jgi:hypothetical protein
MPERRQTRSGKHGDRPRGTTAARRAS